MYEIKNLWCDDDAVTISDDAIFWGLLVAYGVLM